MKALAAIAITCFGVGFTIGWASGKAHDMTGFIPVLPRWL